MSECAHRSLRSGTGARCSTFTTRPLAVILMSPGCVISWTAVGPSRPGLTIVARLDANACKNKPQSVGELVNSHDHTALGEIWALAGGGGANTKIAAATALARNSFIGTPVSFNRDTLTSRYDDNQTTQHDRLYR